MKEKKKKTIKRRKRREEEKEDELVCSIYRQIFQLIIIAGFDKQIFRSVITDKFYR